MNQFDVAILAGGKGTRLRERAGNVPKPLVPVGGRPLLLHQLELCRRSGFNRVLLLVHHLYEQIQQLLGDGTALGLEIGYHVETQARGTAGALRDALHLLAPRFLVLYGDTFLDVDLRSLWRSHERSGAAGTLFLHPNDHPEDSDLVELGSDGRVTAIHPYPHPPGAVYRNLVNAALYVFENGTLEAYASATAPSDIARHMFPAMLADQVTLHGYVSAEYIKDMGTPARLDKVECDIASGLVDRLSLRRKRHAVFMDRDGTINREVGHLKRADDIELLPNAASAIRALNRQGLLAVVVTNQPVVARGDVTEAQLQHIHAKLEWMLGQEGAYLDGIYACPHHPDSGFAGEVAALKIDCRCRKPETALVDAACAQMAIDPRASWFVGDTTTDVECGRRAGLRTIVLQTGHAGRDGKFPVRADYEAPDLQAAVHWIIRGRVHLGAQLAACVGKAASSRLIVIGGLARSGKSSAAQVLKEELSHRGHPAHVISLDGWLLPATARSEGAGVLSRYSITQALESLLPLAGARTAGRLAIPRYDRLKRMPVEPATTVCIGPDDILIVEGVPALLIEELRAASGLRLYVEVKELEREQRLRADYVGRGVSPLDIDRMLSSRETDEVPVVRASAAHAHYVIQSGSPS